METKVYAGRLKDRDELKKSSSGGAFTALSDIFLSNGDAVAASLYDYSEDKLLFSIFTDKTSRDQARGSKYFQSNMGNVIKDCHSWLDQHPDKKLMFVGTGCQAEAFRAFMETCGLSERIITVDLICYGILSPEFWSSYLKYKLPNENQKYSDITFKDKRNGWNHPSALLRVNGKEVPIEDYVKIFYSKNALRQSCYKCPYTTIKRKTDITIGDFWGIDQHIPDFYDPMGNSVLLIHTQQGQELFDSAGDSLDYIESNIQECMQSHLKKPTECPDKRIDFWKSYKQRGIQEVMKKYATDSFYDKAKERIKKTIENIVRGGGYKAPSWLYSYLVYNYTFCYTYFVLGGVA